MIATEAQPGAARESSLARDAYFSDGYFALPQLFSLAYQVHSIHRLQPKSVIEIGIGNGFTSRFLQSAGYDVTTVDINPALGPDICAPLCDVPRHIDRKFDLVVCCEVLEHMPFSEFQANLATMTSIGDRLFMTLPNYKKFFGIGGMLKLPKLREREVSAYWGFRQRRPLSDQHFWEVGSEEATELRRILALLRTHYSRVETGRVAMKPYHQWFVAT